MKALSRAGSSFTKGARFSMRKSTSKKENATENDSTFESNTPHWEAPLKRAETDAILAEDEANQLLESATAAAVDLEEVKKDTRNALLAVIKMERQGEMVDHDLLKGVIDMFIDLGLGQLNVYTTEFEEAFLSVTSDYEPSSAF